MGYRSDKGVVLGWVVNVGVGTGEGIWVLGRGDGEIVDGNVGCGFVGVFS